MSRNITTAMVLAAGLGTRLRPLTLDRPKALVQVAGRSLIDHMLDRLSAGGITRVVVNLHAFADELEHHLRARKGGPDIAFSREIDTPLETGGGVKHAKDLLGDAPILVANIDSVWRLRGHDPVARLIADFDPQTMDALLLLTPTARALGFDGPGDFFQDSSGRLTPRRQITGAAEAPFAYVGLHATRLEPIYQQPQSRFGLAPLWGEMSRDGRLFGAHLEGDWMHVGDPKAHHWAEAVLQNQVSFDDALLSYAGCSR